MNTHDLKIFEAVAFHENFTKAAEAVFTVQSNVTARIKSLEEELGTELFIRSTRKVELTAAGKTLMLYSKKINLLVDEAKQEMLNTSKIVGDLKIGCIESTMVLKAPELIVQFGEKYPDVNLEFRSAMRDSLIHDLLNYKLDAIFVPAPINQLEFQQKKIGTDELVIITPQYHKKIEDVYKDQPIKIVVFEQGCVFRTRLETWLGAKGIVNYKPIILNSIEAIINFVEAGIGISLLPDEIIKQYYSNRNIKTFPVGKELGTMTMLLLYRKDMAPSSALKAFIEYGL